MITRPLVVLVACFGVSMMIQSLVPKVVAIKKASNIDEYMVEDHRTRKRHNYMVQRARSDELGNKPNVVLIHDTEPFDPEANPEELSAFIVDYANMMRNDVVLLDNSIETRTHKRGNIKVENHNQAILDPPCSCEYIKGIKDLGENAYPRYVETRNCSKAQKTCLPPYLCMESLYNLTILRMRDASTKQESILVPNDLKYQWIAEKVPVSVGCMCARDYIIQN